MVKCHLCGEETTPLKDAKDLRGTDSYVVMYWCYDCEVEPIVKESDDKGENNGLYR